MNTLQAKSVQNSGQIQTNQYINYIQHIADEPERFDVTYFFVCDDHFYENWIYNNKLSFSENWISNTKISTCFSTLEVARKVQARLKKKYPDCTVKCMTRFFNEEHDPERLTLLAIINDDDPERFYVTCFYLQIDLSIEDEGFSGTVLSFATEEQAMAAGEIALKYHSQCGIQEMTYFFYGEDGEGRKSVLASRIDDSLDNIRSNLSAYFEAEKAQSEVCNDL